MSIRTATVFFCFGLLFSIKLHAQQPVRILMEQEKAVAVSFVFSDEPSFWKVYRAGSEHAIAGRQEVRNDSVLFRPAISFQPGGRYLIKQHQNTRYEFSVPPVSSTRPRVDHIYPSADSLPSNLLKFYIRFSEPMSEETPYDDIHLLNASGDTLDGVFLKQEPALWNRERTMLSLWMDPGRIKRDLELNKRQGAPLEAATRYRLVIGSRFKSRMGEPLQEAALKEFRTGTADRSKPTLKQWRIDIPEAESKEPLRIRFNEYMDFLSTTGRIEILKNGNTLSGAAFFEENEQEWVFRPEQKWKSGTYVIRADARIEDLAGNNLNKLFDRETSKSEDAERPYYMRQLTIE